MINLTYFELIPKISEYSAFLLSFLLKILFNGVDPYNEKIKLRLLNSSTNHGWQ